jgi:outer membrane protein TolC
MKKIIYLILTTLFALAAVAQNTLTLEQCKAFARQNNYGVRQADNNIASAEETVKEARAAFLPTVSGSGLYYRSTDDILGADFMGQSIRSGKDLYSIGVSATMPIYAGGQINNSYKLSKIGAEQSYLEKKRTLRDIDIQTEKYYWQTVGLEAKRKTLDEADTLLAEIHYTVANAVKNGLKTRNDLLQIELRQAEHESDRLRLDNALKVSRKLLAQHIGLNDSTIDICLPAYMQKGTYELPTLPVSSKKEHSQVINNMPENQMLSKQIDADKLETKIEYGKLLPTLAVSMGYDYTHFWDNTSGGAAVYATVSVPISDWLWGGTTHAVKSKQKKLENSRLEQINSRQMISIQLDKLWYDVEESYKNLAIAQKAIDQSEENLRLNRNAYQSGTLTMTELLNAELLLQQARDKYTEAFSNYNCRLSEYNSLCGYHSN